MSFAYIGFFSVGVIVCIALLVWFFMRMRVLSRRKVRMQQEQEEELQRGLELHNPDIYGLDLTNPNRVSAVDVYYSNGQPRAAGSRGGPGGSRSQPVLPAVVVSTGEAPNASLYPTPYGIQGEPTPYGEQFADIHGGYGEAEYLPCPPTRSQDAPTAVTDSNEAPATDATQGNRAGKNKQPVEAEVAAEENDSEPTVVEVRDGRHEPL